MPTSNPTNNKDQAKGAGDWEDREVDDEYTFYVDLPGLTIVGVPGIPGTGISAEINYDLHDHDLLVALLSTLDVEIDRVRHAPLLGTSFYTTVRKERTHAEG